MQALFKPNFSVVLAVLIPHRPRAVFLILQITCASIAHKLVLPVNLGA